MNVFNLVFSIMGIVATVLLFGNQAFAYGGYGGYGAAFSNSYSYSSNNNYSLFDRALLSSDKSICFSSNDKLVDPNKEDRLNSGYRSIHVEWEYHKSKKQSKFRLAIIATIIKGR